MEDECSFKWYQPFLYGIFISLWLQIFLFPSNLFGQCFRDAKPYPECSSFWFLESGPRFGTKEAYSGFGHVTSIGYMRNFPENYALGCGIEFSTGSESGTYRLSILPRYRHWFSNDWSGDVALGIGFLGEGYPAIGYKGISAFAEITYRGVIAINVEMETRKLEYETHTSYSIGVRTGSFLAFLEIPLALTIALMIGRGIGSG